MNKWLGNTSLKAHPIQAVLYCRISDKAQERRGSGLASQEATCQEYARFKGYQVVEVFREVLTGGEQNRPVMTSLLAYLSKHKKEGRVVIIDDISRFARDVPGHWFLREQLKAAGGILESPRIEFGDDADSVFRENILASSAQHQRQKNAEQTKSRMRARIVNGHWPFPPPAGYRHERRSGEGMVLVCDEPAASVIKEALEGFASGRFRSQAEVLRFLESNPDFPKDRSGKVRYKQVYDILTRALYAGYVEAPKWNVPLRKGRHQALIDLATHERIQQRLKEGSKAAARADISVDFPLRGSVACAACGNPLTGYWSESHTGRKYPYYMCYSKGCARYRKSIGRDRVEAAFEAMLATLTPSKRLFDLAGAMFKRAWDQRHAQAKVMARSCEKEVQRIEKEVAVLLDRIVETQSGVVIAAYENRIGALEKAKLLATERLAKTDQPRGRFDEMFELAMRFLASPSKIWESGKIEARKMVLRLVFADRLPYSPEQGFRTPKTTMPFNVLDGLNKGDNMMARPKRFELLTPRFVVWCSIQLSYGRVFRLKYRGAHGAPDAAIIPETRICRESGP